MTRQTTSFSISDISNVSYVRIVGRLIFVVLLQLICCWSVIKFLFTSNQCVEMKSTISIVCYFRQFLFRFLFLISDFSFFAFHFYSNELFCEFRSSLTIFYLNGFIGLILLTFSNSFSKIVNKQKTSQKRSRKTSLENTFLH